jgi:indolepyruvate ferredoxin oxidoreductase beta subunit
MSYEDVIRVAQAKIDPARLARIAADMGVKPGEPFTVTEFLKPGIEEMCSILPPGLARRILAIAERRGVIDRWHWGMEVNARRSLYPCGSGCCRGRGDRVRFEEQRAIDLAALIADTAHPGDRARGRGTRLISGYGDILKRGSANYGLIKASSAFLTGHPVGQGIGISPARGRRRCRSRGGPTRACRADQQDRIAAE